MIAQTVKIGEIAEQVRGVTYSKNDASPDESDGMIKILRANNITDNGLKFSNLVWVPKSCVSSKQMLRKGDIIVATSSGSLDVVGKAAPVEDDLKASFGAFCKVVRPGKSIDSHYLANYFKTAKYRSIISGLAAGANINNLRNEHIDNLEIPLPPLAEQKRIAAILDKADAIRRKLQQSLRLSDDFLRSVFLDMFGDPVTNPNEWDKTTVGQEVEFLTSGSRGWAQYYTDKGDFFIRIQNLRGGFLDLSDSAFVDAPDTAEARRTRVQTGDVLLSITADLGRTAVVPENFGKGYINQHLAILRLREMNPVFVSHQLASPGGQRQFISLNRSAVKAGLNFDDIRSVELLRPPLNLQIKFSDIVTKIKKRSSRLQAMLKDAETLFSSLQQRAFRGEL